MWFNYNLFSTPNSSPKNDDKKSMAMAPSAPEHLSLPMPMTELQQLRQRNRELLSQVEQLTLANRCFAAAENQEDRAQPRMVPSSSSFDSGIELRERKNSKGIHEPVEMVRSNSLNSNPSDGNFHNGLHHRHVPGKESTDGENDQRSAHLTPRGRVKSKMSDIDTMHAINAGQVETDSPDESGLKRENGFDNESKKSRIRPGKLLGMRRSADGGGRYTKAIDIENGNFPDVQIKRSEDLGDDDSDDNDTPINDDSSHNKHVNRIGSPTSIEATSVNFPTFKDQLKERGGWLIGLLVLQSCSSFIIEYNEIFLQNHMIIVQYLTMLVGAGGNAGNQAAVGVIRSLAVGTLNSRTMRGFLIREGKMALSLSAFIGLTAFIRAALFRTPAGETIAVTASVCVIVAISVGIGSTLPLGMKKVGIDPAHSSTTIQVIMDILGVLITVCVSSFVLSFKVFQTEDSTGDAGGADGRFL